MMCGNLGSLGSLLDYKPFFEARIIQPNSIAGNHFPFAPLSATLLPSEESTHTGGTPMRRLLTLIAIAPLFTLQPARAAEPDTRVYEMRVYYAAPGKLDALHARFRDHTMKLFEKHGLTNV